MPKSVDARGLTFAYEERGDADAPLALLLHGFPDSPESFIGLLDRLAQSGYRAVAPWLRGYVPTSLAPDGEYHVGALAADANALHDALGGDGRAVLLGHDWGAAALYPALSVDGGQRWRRGVAMSVPPLGVMLSAFAATSQLQRSWYMWLFNTPLGEGALAADDLGLVDVLWSQWSPGLSASERANGVAAAKRALGTPESRAAAIATYRSLFAPPPEDPEALGAQSAAFEVPSVPVLYLHGDDDDCIAVDDFDAVLALLPEGSEARRIREAGHFVVVEQLDAVAAAIAAFLAD